VGPRHNGGCRCRTRKHRDGISWRTVPIRIGL